MRHRRVFSSQEGDEEAAINLTPLIDVVFVVLIIFILVAPMLELDKVELAQSSTGSKKESAQVDGAKGVAIHVHKDNSIWVNGTCVKEENLLLVLQKINARKNEKTVQLFHDKKAAFGTYQAVKNAVEAAGFDEMDVILKP